MASKIELFVFYLIEFNDFIFLHQMSQRLGEFVI